MKRTINNESGNLAIDFIFGITLTFASMAIFFSLSFSLSVTELAQYLAFATARSYNAAHLTKDTQRLQAEKKYDYLMSKPVYKTLLKEGGWFKFGRPQFDNEDGFYNAVSPLDIFVGVKHKFEASMLDMQIPMLGDTSDEGGFVANINAYLGREPSFKECEAYQLSKKAMFTNLGYSMDNDLQVMIDNGC